MTGLIVQHKSMQPLTVNKHATRKAMQKLETLKAHLISTIKNLSLKKIHVFADDGTIACNLNGSLNFSYKYKATIIIEDLTANPDAVFVPLLWWCQHNQVDMQSNDIQFIAEPVDNKKVDLRIELPLDERVIVSQDNNGNYKTEHLSEPTPEYNQASPANLAELHSEHTPSS